MRELLVRVESGSQCSQLASFLRGCRAQPRVIDERSVAIDLDDDGCPGLATLVAAVEEWRSSSRAGEVSLVLGGEVRVLRTEA
jgi:hypothetical protein